MKLYYFNLNTSKFPNEIKESFKYEREIKYLKTKYYDIPIVVIKIDNDLVEDVVTHENYLLNDNDNLLNGYITREINYEDYSSLINIINPRDKEYYIDYMKKIHNILIEKENIKAERKRNKNIKERLLIM